MSLGLGRGLPTGPDLVQLTAQRLYQEHVAQGDLGLVGQRLENAPVGSGENLLVASRPHGPQGVLLAFTVGVLTIIPAVLMSLGQSRDFWPQYFLIALGMAAGSFLGFVFVRLAGRLTSKDDQPTN